MDCIVVVFQNTRKEPTCTLETVDSRSVAQCSPETDRVGNESGLIKAANTMEQHQTSTPADDGNFRPTSRAGT
jgi:hypothetical protein